MGVLRYKMLHDKATAPVRYHSGDLGYDLFSIYEHWIEPGQKVKISTGISFEFPNGWGGFVKDRSSMAVNTTLEVIGGVIDNGYVGELFVMMANYGKKGVKVEAGQKIAQLVLIPTTHFLLEEVDSFDLQVKDERGESGFGSTGR